jgi:Bifunctional DNA primase/polymerase, N-terminal
MEEKAAIKGWKQAATTDPDQIREWWSQCPKAVPRIEVGRAGLVVIDADRRNPKEDGVQAFAALGDEHQESPHPQTLTPGRRTSLPSGARGPGLWK